MPARDSASNQTIIARLLLLSVSRRGRSFLACRLPPMENWLASYRKEWLRPDVIAGVTTAAVIIPKAMADATISGLPVEVGLYTALLPMGVSSVLGTSPLLCVRT